MTNVFVSIWGCIPIKSVAFQQYALSVLMSQAVNIADRWNLDLPKPITTNDITYLSIRPKTNSWDGAMSINNKYGFRVEDNKLILFRDYRYHCNTFLGNDAASDNLAQSNNCLTLDASRIIASNAMYNIGLTQYASGNPTTLRQYKYDSNNVIYPLPLYAVRWESDAGCILLQISGISSNVAEFCNATEAESMKIPLPTNYLTLLGLPKDVVFVKTKKDNLPNEYYNIINKSTNNLGSTITTPK
jgi:hypothetical protein